MTNLIDPRIAAEAKYCDLDAHRMHNKAMNEDPDRIMSRLFWQWNKTYTGWVRTAEYRRLDVVKMGRSQHIRYNLDGSVRDLIGC
jgi:hypothetical protein